VKGRRRLLVLAGVLLVAALFVAFRRPLERVALEAILDLALGSRVQIGEMRLGTTRAELRDVHVERSGGSLFDAQRVAVAYDLRDLLPGSAHRYGLREVELDRPVLTIRRLRDGSFNLGNLGGGGGTGGNRPVAEARVAQAPLALHALVRDGAAILLDAYRFHANARDQRIERIDVSAAIDSARRTNYRATGAYRAGSAAYALRADGTIDALRAFALHRLRARTLPIAALADYFIDSSVAIVTAGMARDVDLRAYAIGPSAPYHITGDAVISDGRLAVAALAKPLLNLNGRVDAFDAGIAAPSLSGTVAHTFVRVCGGVLNLTNPQLRLGIATDGPLETLRGVFAFSAQQPVTGEVRIRTLIEGPAADPMIVASFTGRTLAYRALPASGTRGTIAFYHEAASIVPFVARYGGIDVRVYGAVETAAATIGTFVVSAAAQADVLPYAAQLVRGARLTGTGLVAEWNAAFSTRGIVTGSGGGQSLQALFAVDPLGDGAFSPVLIGHADGSSLAGGLYLNRSKNRSAFWIDARRFAATAAAAHPTLPGLPGLSPPPFAGVLDGTVGGIGPPSAFALAGIVRLRDAELGGLRVADATGRVAGSPGDLRIGAAHAAGAWGSFDGAGAYDGRLGLRGTYRGSLGQLEAFTGRIGATGALTAPVALLVDPRETVVQTPGTRSSGASVLGVPVDSFSGTLAASGSGVRVLSARASVAGGGIAAAGTFARGVGVAVSGADARRLRAAGMPLDAGSFSALGVAKSQGGALRFDGGALVEGAAFARVPLAANGDVHLLGPDVRFDRVDLAAYSTWGSLSGRVLDVASERRRYDLRLTVRAADLGDMAAQAKIPGATRYHVDGSADGDVRIRGSGRRPTAEGTVRVPEATVNGLFLERASADVTADPSLVGIQTGRLVVGSTVVRFGGALMRGDASVTVDAQRTNLPDFNGFFDPGDMLAGSGHMALAFRRTSGYVHTTGDLALEGLRIAHFSLGDANATWSSGGARITGRGGFAGVTGALDATGSVTVPRRAPLDHLLGRATFDVRSRAAGIDLGALLPALGYDLPVGGRLDGAATVKGKFPALALGGDATLVGGTYGRLPIDRLTVAANSSFSRATITDAELEVGSISARGSGSFGFKPRDPLSIAVHASSADIGAVVAKLTGNRLPLRGSFEADLRASGVASKPIVNGGFDVENGAVAGVAVPRALGEVSLAGRNLQLRDAEIAFSTGTLYLAGTIPLTVAPFGFGPPSAPITLELAAKGVNLSDFTPLLPHGSSAKGELGGRVAVSGTVATPRLSGELTLAGGAFDVPSIERLPLGGITGRLAFAGTSARLEGLHADVGGGSVDVTGSAALPDLEHPGIDGTYDLRAAFRGARLDLPAYGKGQVDGTLTFHHVPRSLAVVGGAVSLQDAVIPFSALYNPAAGGTNDALTIATGSRTPGGLPNVAFDLDAFAGRNVRVRSSVIDIGGTGSLHVGGTLADPQLRGVFDSAGGTLTYFNRVFRVDHGTVTFQPDFGIIPALDAVAVAHVVNPDPNPQRNPTGSADITLTVRGPVTNLNIALDSDPPYDRQQILGLLLNVPAIGGTTLFGNAPAPGLTVGQEAFGVLNAQFTRSLLAPLETAFGGALGLSNLNVTFDYTGNVGFSARKVLGKTINAVYATTFGYPYRQTFGFEIRPSPSTAAQLTFYETFGVVGPGLLPPAVLGGVNRVVVGQPITGTNGFTFTLQRFFR
jgi:hypothetical protein